MVQQNGAIKKALEYLQNAIEHARDEGKNARADTYQEGLDNARAELAEKDKRITDMEAEIKVLQESVNAGATYTAAVERYFALSFDERTKAEQGRLLAASDAWEAARAQVKP